MLPVKGRDNLKSSECFLLLATKYANADFIGVGQIKNPFVS